MPFIMIPGAKFVTWAMNYIPMVPLMLSIHAAYPYILVRVSILLLYMSEILSEVLPQGIRIFGTPASILLFLSLFIAIVQLISVRRLK